MKTIPGTSIILPESMPIHLEGEADAYANESRENALARLHYAGCESGFVVVPSEPHGIIVYCASRAFRLAYSKDGLRLKSVWWRANDTRAMWHLGKRLQ